MINVTMPRESGNVGIAARELNSDIIYRVIGLPNSEMDNCLAVLSECKDFIIFFGDDSFVSSGSIDWATEIGMMFVATRLELFIHFA